MHLVYHIDNIQELMFPRGLPESKLGQGSLTEHDLSEEVQMSMLISDKWAVEESSSNCLWFHH